MRHASTITRTQPPPIMAARQWLQNRQANPDLPLLDLSQAAPSDPPPPRMRAYLARLITDDDTTHFYGPVLGNPDLREAIAVRWSALYGGAITPGQTAITSGCNQAFCAAIAACADPGDAVILPAPWYFNHKMHLDMSGIKTRALRCDGDMLPDPDHAAALIDRRTRAIVLVSPNNPTGAEYPDQSDPRLRRSRPKVRHRPDPR